MFCADWSAACAHLDPTFAELSVRYSTSKLRFAKLDIGRWPEAAKLFNVNLDAFGSASQVTRGRIHIGGVYMQKQ